MDGATEPIIAVLGHPIAGNPSQFALESAFQAMELDWRVLSLDVTPENMDTAIQGATVMGFRGMLLDDIGAAAAIATETEEIKSSPEKEPEGGETEKSEKEVISAPPTCFYRDPENKAMFLRENAESRWLEELIRRHFRTQKDEEAANAMGPVLWIGEIDPRFPETMVDIDTQSPIAWAASESIEQANLIVLSESVNVDGWPGNDGTTLVIDLSDRKGGLDGGRHTKLKKLGYTFISVEERRAAALSQCVFRWTGVRPSIEIIQEAIEEYLAV